MFQNLEHRFSTSVLTKAQSVTCLFGMYSLLGGLPDGSDGKESACNAGGPDSIPGSVRSPGGGHDNPLQYSCLENPVDRGAWMGPQTMRHNWVTSTITVHFCTSFESVPAAVLLHWRFFDAFVFSWSVYPTLCDPMNCSSPGSSVHETFPGKNIGVGCGFLLPGIFPTQGSNPGLLHCRRTLYHLSHQGSPGFSLCC